MSSYKYILQKKSPLCKAIRCLLQMFSVPSDHIIAEGEHFAVKAGSRIHIGVLPLISTLRSTTTDTGLKAFVGTDVAVYPLLNQWVSTALLLSASATCEHSSVCTSITKQIFAEIEKCVECFDLRKSFLAGTPRATVADFLLYAAIHGHPNAMTEALPSTVAWSLHAQSDPYLKPLLSEAAVAEAEAKLTNLVKSKKTVFVKPSEEEILRRRMEKEKEKQEKLAKAAAAATSSSSDAKEVKSQQQKQKQKESVALDPNTLDIRVGRFTQVKRHPDADRLYVEEMDLGSEKRTIVSGLVEHYKSEELEGTLCLAVCNMKPKPLKGVTSHGMVLCASTEKTLRLVRPPEGAQPGDRILFADVFDAERLQETKQLSGNAMSALIGFLRTDNEGIVRWRDIPAVHAAGILKVTEVTNAVVK
ncbi:tRNA-binding domain [Trypanosoma melophagium]|uniref:tRNA-binding domain n=1 Tax=Trypanosoma melophagium TaxID=715481 RepID=UPI00351A88E2|nr:tRNA-binding domain [Trypanosoma melophagium]